MRAHVRNGHGPDREGIASTLAFGMAPPEGATSTSTNFVRAMLRVPLVAKLAGANAIIVLVAFTAALLMRGGSAAATPIGGSLLLVVGLALVGSLVINTALVLLALRPLQQLEAAAERVSRGDFDARVIPSMLADRDVARVGSTINLLLNGVATDRARTRRLAADVIEAGDKERAYIARELHGSVSQSLAALLMQLSAAARDCESPALAARLSTMRELGATSLEEVRTLAHTMHPRALDDLGLPSALAHLARQAALPNGAAIKLEAQQQLGPADLPPDVASVLYRVAQDALGNAMRHSHALNVRIRVAIDEGHVELSVSDDGLGFNVADALERRPGMGLFTMRERATLVDGRFSITSEPGLGTRVAIEIPFRPAAGESGEETT